MRTPLIRALVLSLAASVSAQTQTPLPFTAGTWTLTRLSDAQGTLDLRGVQQPPTLSFPEAAQNTPDQVRVAGSTGCNTYAGAGVFRPPSVRLGPLAVTQRACLGERAELERRFVGALRQVRSLTVFEGQLTLRTGSARLVFQQDTAAVPARLVATWRLVGATGDRPPTLTLGADGSVGGWTGCNRLRGSVQVEADTLRFSPLLTTRAACRDTALAQQERDFLEQLSGPARYSLQGATLVLTRDDGASLTLARPVDAP